MPRDLPSAADAEPAARGPAEAIDPRAQVDLKATALHGAVTPRDTSEPSVRSLVLSSQRRDETKLHALDGAAPPDKDGVSALPTTTSATSDIPRSRSDAQSSASDSPTSAADSTPVLDERLSEIYGASVRTPAGRAYFEAGDPIIGSALRAEPMAGHFSADLHGSPDGFTVGAEELDAHDLAQLVRVDPHWESQPVRLISRETGQGPTPVAQELANELGVPVVAPTETVVVDADTGEIYTTAFYVDENVIERDVVPYNGKWIEFQPTESDDKAGG